mmetsp:Transcript_96572/g.270322  ORF Transcript_96572/g.270322 Transcript_96572/m.270322 type:complete len:218 (+) Transcript_96572:188-841(+)
MTPAASCIAPRRSSRGAAPPHGAAPGGRHIGVSRLQLGQHAGVDEDDGAHVEDVEDRPLIEFGGVRAEAVCVLGRPAARGRQGDHQERQRAEGAAHDHRKRGAATLLHAEHKAETTEREAPIHRDLARGVDVDEAQIELDDADEHAEDLCPSDPPCGRVRVGEGGAGEGSRGNGSEEQREGPNAKPFRMRGEEVPGHDDAVAVVVCEDLVRRAGEAK